MIKYIKQRLKLVKNKNVFVTELLDKRDFVE